MFPAKTTPRALLLVALALAADAAAATSARVVLPDDVLPSAYRIELAPDAQAGRFTASVEIDLQVRRATRRIVLNAADLAIDAVAVDGAAKAPAVRLDERRETASFLLDHALAPGAHTLK